MSVTTAALLYAIAAQIQSSIKEPTFKITVRHKTGMELAKEEEIRRKKIKSLQRKNKRRKK